MSDHYALIGIARDADAATIRSAYRRAMRSAHPDVARDDGARAQALNHAFAVLSNEETRAAYDRDIGQSGAAASGQVGERAVSFAVQEHGGAQPRRDPLPISWIVILALLMNALLILGVATGGRF
ncbi:DnaJ domain-containing protein [Sphingomicrobium sp. XHP0239]|uniref:DnaJ domain-containing protein n=1 Tax=Sphingomicrobium maritimum TaxID=3133972 RepID=UPI0031CC62BE